MALTCPKCGSTRVAVFYTGPLSYRCESCGARLRDRNAPGIPVLSAEEARQKRPALYGLPACARCGHAQHNASNAADPESCPACPVCAAESTPREVVLEVAP